MREEVLGTIILHETAKLVFSTSEWKGKHCANVRKFVATARYDGPTKSGLLMSGEVLVAVLEALRRLQTEVPGVKETEFARISKSTRKQIVIRTVPPEDLHSLPGVDVREFLESSKYTGPTKKGVRFSWGKLSEVINLLQTLAQRLGTSEKRQSRLFPEIQIEWIEKALQNGELKSPAHDEVIVQILPDGPKDFPNDFLTDQNSKASMVQLPPEPIAVAQLPDGKYVVRSNLGFSHPVRNKIEGDFIAYASLRGHKVVYVPNAMITVFRAVKAYENYLRELQRSLIQAYERKSGHRPVAEHKAREIFQGFGLPLISRS